MNERNVNAVFDAIVAAGDVPIPARVIAAEQGLTRKQVYRATVAIRELFKDPANGQWSPLVSSPKGYRFTMDADAIRRFRHARGMNAITTMDRLWHSAIKPEMHHAAIDPRTVTIIEGAFLDTVRQMERIIA